jgi:hypothetical protein
MIEGPGEEDRVRGEIRARIAEDRLVDFSYRVARRSDLVRCEDPQGRIHVIAGQDTVWSCDPYSGQLDVSPRSPGVNPAPDDFEFGCARPTEERWEADDFTAQTADEVPVTFLGRRGWAVELAPPKHKPFAMQIVIDAATGLLLREGNDAFGTFHEWTELDTTAELPDELFRFNPQTDTLAQPLTR